MTLLPVTMKIPFILGPFDHMKPVEWNERFTLFGTSYLPLTGNFRNSELLLILRWFPNLRFWCSKSIKERVLVRVQTSSVEMSVILSGCRTSIWSNPAVEEPAIEWTGKGLEVLVRGCWRFKFLYMDYIRTFSKELSLPVQQSSSVLYQFFKNIQAAGKLFIAGHQFFSF